MTERETGRGTLYIGYCGFTFLTLTLVSVVLYGRHQSAVILQLRIELRHIPLWRFEWRISQSWQQLYRRSNHECQSCLSKCVFEMRMGINRKYLKCQCCHLFVHKYSSMWPYWPLKLGFKLDITWLSIRLDDRYLDATGEWVPKIRCRFGLLIQSSFHFRLVLSRHSIMWSFRVTQLPYRIYVSSETLIITG